MRSELEMLELILSTARADDRIRAIIMNGSRTNPNTRRDPFQDFDIVYLVTDLDSFLSNPGWIDRFGKRMILQLPDDMHDPPQENHDGYTYLMQFTDGNRIDLRLQLVSLLHELEEDSLSIPLLDKDGILPAFPAPSESSYLPKPPSAKQFADCCNEFWWVSPYVAKGLWRGQLVYAKAMTEIIREQLIKMMTWYVGMSTHFQENIGGYGKYLHKYLEPALWEKLQLTWCDADFEHTWDAVFLMGDLFRTCAQNVAGHFGYAYPYEDDRRVSNHLRHVRTLPPEATEIY